MTFIPDLSPCHYFGDAPARSAHRLVAVGWLDDRLPAAPASRTELEPLLKRLVEIWQAGVDPWGVIMGRHGCGLCGAPADRAPPTVVEYLGARLQLGSGYVTVPGRNQLFVAPSLVIHYIAAHGYCPPASFREALAACPRPRSRRYGRALREGGAPWLAHDWYGLPLGSWRSWAMQRVPVARLVRTPTGRWVLRRLQSCLQGWRDADEGAAEAQV